MCEAHEIEVLTTSDICQPIILRSQQYCKAKSGADILQIRLQIVHHIAATSVDLRRHNVSRQHATDR